MKINLIHRNGVFIPCYDEDYENAKMIKSDVILRCDIKTQRNPELNKKYHLMIERAWQCLNEAQTSFFGRKEAFRKSMEVTAGFFEPVYNFAENKWQKAPKSTSFESMSEEEFRELYNRVLDAIHALLTNKSMTESQFEAVFSGF